MGGQKWWEKIPTLVMIFSVLISPARLYADELILVQTSALGPAAPGEIDVVDPLTDIKGFDPLTSTGGFPIFTEYADFTTSLTPERVVDSVCQITPHPFDADVKVLPLFKATDAGPVGVAIQSGLAVVTCFTSATIELFDPTTGADLVPTPLAVPAGSGLGPWAAAFSPTSSTVFMTDRAIPPIPAVTGSILTLVTAPVVGAVLATPVAAGAAISDANDIQITPDGTTGWLTDSRGPGVTGNNAFGFGGGVRVVRFSTATPATQLAVSTPTTSGPWGLTILPSAVELWVFDNAGNVFIIPNDEVGAAVAFTTKSLLAGDVATAPLTLGAPLWDGIATSDSGKVFISLHYDVLGPAPDAPGPSVSPEPGALIRIISSDPTLTKFTAASVSGGPKSIDVEGDPFNYDCAIRPPVLFAGGVPGKRKSGGHACFVGTMERGSGIPMLPLALLGLSGLVLYCHTTRKRDEEDVPVLGPEKIG